MRRATLLLIVALLAGAGCLAGDDPADLRDDYVDAAAAAFTSGNGGPPLPAELARCVGAALVDLPGATELREAGVSTQELADADDLRSLDVDLPDDAPERLAAELGDCELGAAVEGPLLDAFAAESGGPISDDAADCVTEGADDDAIESGLAATFIDRTDGAAGFDELLAALGGCPDAVGDLLVNGFGQQRGGELDEGTASCVRDHVAANPEEAGATFSEGGAAADRYAASLVVACPGLAPDGAPAS